MLFSFCLVGSKDLTTETKYRTVRFKSLICPLCGFQVLGAKCSSIGTRRQEHWLPHCIDFGIVITYMYMLVIQSFCHCLLHLDTSHLVCLLFRFAREVSLVNIEKTVNLYICVCCFQHVYDIYVERLYWILAALSIGIAITLSTIVPCDI